MICKNCVNTTKNPHISINKKGICNVCSAFNKGYNKKSLLKELKLFKSFIGKSKGKYDIMVGISGGKDSSATLYQIKQMGFNPLAFTFDPGYLHPYIFRRAKNVAKKLGIDHKIIKIKKYVTKKEKKLFKNMSKLYSRNKKEEFQKEYKNGRKNYNSSIRPCWVCRKIFIKAYYAEALKQGINIIAIGINEWTCLKQTTNNNKFQISALRKLTPFSNKKSVYIVHFPFLIGDKLNDTKKILKKIGWNYYKNVQSNAYSCLLAHSAEKQLFDNLGFHPDSTRLAREVTVGFMKRNQALKAMKKPLKPKMTVQEVLKKAGLI